MINKILNLGGLEVKKFGCLCFCGDNRNGFGVYDDEDGKPLFWISGECFIYGMELRGEDENVF